MYDKDWVQNELTAEGLPLRKGDENKEVKRVQEWCTLHGIGTAVDSIYGPATEGAVRDFQRREGLPKTGVVDKTTWSSLVAPMRKAMRPLPSAPVDPANRQPLPEMVAWVADEHLAQRPRELDKRNEGPWVRLYMQGESGPEYPWCAGFVSFVTHSAAALIGADAPVEYTWSCDLLAQEAKREGRFVAGLDDTALANLDESGDPAIFLVRASERDWTHTGLITGWKGSYVKTIEGNTNDSGDREGYEVCRRTRKLGPHLDIVTLD